MRYVGVFLCAPSIVDGTAMSVSLIGEVLAVYLHRKAVSFFLWNKVPDNCVSVA